MFNNSNFARIMADKKITGKKLSKSTGIPQETISRLKRGRINNPLLSTLVTLAKELDVSIDQLVVWDESKAAIKE